MPFLNKTFLMGRLVGDPSELRKAGDQEVCNFRIAVDDRFSKGKDDKKTLFIGVTAWRGNAKFVSDYLKKGDLVIVEGRLQQRTYEKDGNNITVIEVTADDVQSAESKAAAEARRAGQGGSSKAPTKSKPKTATEAEFEEQAATGDQESVELPF